MDSCKTRTPSPNTKIIKNLCTSACCDPDHTPRVVPEVRKATPTPTQRKGKRGQTPGTPEEESPSQEGRGERWTWSSGIISLAKLEKKGKTSHRVTQGRGRPSAAFKEAMAASAAVEEQRKVKDRHNFGQNYFSRFRSVFEGSTVTEIIIAGDQLSARWS